MKPRAMGKVLFDDTTVKNSIVEDAKRSQRQKQELIRLRREARPDKPLLNRDRYPEKYAAWLKTHPTGHGKQPHCWMCREAVIHWDEPAHVCEGFKPMYTEHDQVWQDRREAEREAIREARRRGNGIYCDGCGELIEDEDEARWHDEHCERDPESDSWRSHHIAVNGDEDDLSGYEDEPEDDYCEDDGDPMWE